MSNYIFECHFQSFLKFIRSKFFFTSARNSLSSSVNRALSIRSFNSLTAPKICFLRSLNSPSWSVNCLRISSWCSFINNLFNCFWCAYIVVIQPVTFFFPANFGFSISFNLAPFSPALLANLVTISGMTSSCSKVPAMWPAVMPQPYFHLINMHP